MSSLENLYNKYEEYKFMCDILCLEALPMRDEKAFSNHMRNTLDEHNARNVMELQEKLKLYEIWEQ